MTSVAGDRKYSRNAGLEHRHPVAQDEGPREVTAGGGKGKEADVPGGMPPAVLALLPLCCLGGWTAVGGGDGNPEEVSQLPGHQVGKILLKDVRIRQE